jgi:hypothetical protein
MFRFAPPITLRLVRGELLRWQQGRVRVRVLSGTAWVTRPNDPSDHFLRAGQAMELRRGLIGAEQDLCVRLEASRPGPRPFWRGAASVAQGLRALWLRRAGTRPVAPLPAC